MKFFRLTQGQRQVFDGLRTTDQMEQHGPLAEGEEVPVHQHARALYLLAKGSAVYVDADGNQLTTLGADEQYDAVMVNDGEKHGWISKVAEVVIEHVIGGSNVDAVLAAA